LTFSFDLLELSINNGQNSSRYPKLKLLWRILNGKPRTKYCRGKAEALPSGVYLAKVINDEAGAWEVNS